MDEAKRRELYARREAILAEKARLARIAAWEDMVRWVPILSALEGAGEDYASNGYRGLTGALNEWAHDARLYPMRERSWAALPLDPPERDAIILAALRAHLGDDEDVTVVLCRERMILRMRMPVLVRHLATLVADGEGDRIGFAAPPADWIVAIAQRPAIEQSEIVTGTLVRAPQGP